MPVCHRPEGASGKWHFFKYKLLTQKAADFILFTKIVKLINTKAHLTNEGLHQIINIKASLNLGISENLKSYFTKITPVERPIEKTKKIPDPPLHLPMPVCHRPEGASGPLHLSIGQMKWID